MIACDRYDKYYRIKNKPITFIEQLRKRIQISDKLREYDPGNWLGKPFSEFQDKEWEEHESLNIDYKFEGGESLRQVESRMMEWLTSNFTCNDHILNRWRDPELKEKKLDPINVFVFSHGQAIKSLLHGIMGFNSSLITKIAIENTSVSSVSFSKYGWFINYINNNSHLNLVY